MSWSRLQCQGLVRLGWQGLGSGHRLVTSRKMLGVLDSVPGCIMPLFRMLSRIELGVGCIGVGSPGLGPGLSRSWGEAP